MTEKRSARAVRRRSFGVSGWPLRRKMALSLAIPLILAAVYGGLRVSAYAGEASNAAASSEQVTVLPPAAAYLAAAEQAMVAAQGSSEADAKALDAAVHQLGTTANQLRTAADDANLTSEQRYQVDSLLDLSQAMRGDSDALSAGTWLAQLRQLQSGVSQLVTSIANAQLEPLPELAVLSDTLEGRFSLAMQQALVQTDRSGETGSQDLFAEVGVEGAAIDSLAAAVGAEQADTVAALRTANADRARAIRTGDDDLGGEAAYQQYDALVTSLLGDIDTRLANAADAAWTRALVAAGFMAGAMLVAIILALLVSRLLLRPIRTVRESALTIAHERLPEEVRQIRAGIDPGEVAPIDVMTEEEIGQLARAVDDLHRQAVLLAADEAALRSQVAEMFVILSRRTNSLINQQLAQIEALEKDEEDPRRLDSLFRLDHLASRMRRTSDSLLILADAPTRGAAQEPLSVSDTMQAATSGVQDYQRVRVLTASPMQVSAAAAADVVHMLTELIDNALSFSAPTTTVALTSTMSPSGLTIEIVDSGLGVPAEALGDLNRLLRSGGDITPETARRMGLFVVSRLAQRHGILVTLRRNEHEGMTASVTLPSTVLVEDPVPSAPGAPLTVVPPLTAVAPPAPAPEPLPAAPVASVPSLVPVEPLVPAPAPVPAPVPMASGSTGVPPALPLRRPGTSEVPGAPVPIPVAQPSVPETAPPVPVVPVAPVAPPAPPAPPAPAVWSDPVEPVTPRTAADYLDSPPANPAPDDFVTPIFSSIRSGWLGSDPQPGSWSSTEVEAGWERADRVNRLSSASHLTSAGLPVRHPGAHLVPGGVTKPASTVRDPEAIRARLAAHAAGVSRGRNVAATGTVDDPSTKAGH
jgi:signal transduction histidine kinase